MTRVKGEHDSILDEIDFVEDSEDSETDSFAVVDSTQPDTTSKPEAVKEENQHDRDEKPVDETQKNLKENIISDSADHDPAYQREEDRGCDRDEEHANEPRAPLSPNIRTLPISEQESSNGDRDADDLRDGLKENIRVLSNRRRPLNVLILGKPSQGKTAFLFSCAVASLKKWGQYMVVGKHGSRSYNTTYLKRLNVLDPLEGDPMIIRRPEENEDEAFLKKYCPRFFDLAGMPDENNKRTREVFRRILYGGIPLGTSLLDVIREVSMPGGTEKVRRKYWRRNDELAIDRVVVVMSAIEDYPKDLIEALMCAAHPKGVPDEDDGITYKRTVPVFGLITMMDKRDTMNSTELDKSNTREENFVSALGLIGAQDRFGKVTNYFSENPGQVPRSDRINDPRKDIKILTFLDYLFDPNLQVEHEGDAPHNPINLDYFKKAMTYFRQHSTETFIAALVLIIGILVFYVIRLSNKLA